MIPLADMHCHLLAGLDDGPRTPEEAVAMCRMVYEEGVRLSAASVQYNERYGRLEPERIRQATLALRADLIKANIPLTVAPTAAIMAFPEMVEAWQEGKLMSVADRKAFMLVEMPPRLFVDLRETARRFQPLGMRIILAHPERHPELLH